MSSDPKFSIVMPVYNEADGIEQTLGSFYNEVVGTSRVEFIVAEDGSTDGTRDVLFKLSQKLPLKLYLGDKRKGYALAAKDALRQATAEYVFFSDSDGQYFPSDFWNLWEKRSKGDVIIGRKVVRSEGVHRVILSRGFHVLARLLFGVRLNDIDSGFRLIEKKALLAVLDKVGKLEYSFWGEFTIRACARRLRVIEVPIRHSRRRQGESRIYGWRKLPTVVAFQLLGLLRLKLEMVSKA